MKQKTKKAAKKRFHIANSGAIKRRVVKQGHFNAKASGNETRAKHVDKPVSSSDQKRVADLLPYS